MVRIQEEAIVRRSGLSLVLLLAVALLVAFLSLRSIVPKTETPGGPDHVSDNPVQQANELVEEYNSRTDMYNEDAE